LSVDTAQALACLALRDTAVSLAASAAEADSGPRARYFDQLHGHFAAMPASAATAAFRPASAFLHLADARHETTAEGALGLVRFAVGGPLGTSLAIAVPEAAFPEHGLHFPHLDAIVQPAGGPVVIESDADEVSFIWVDGSSATLPACGIANIGDTGVDRVTAVPRVAGLAMLNACAEVHDSSSGVSPPASMSIQPDEIEALEQGAALLADVWPAAANASARFFNSVVVQPVQQDHVTSMTSDRLQGALITSCRDPIQVADALCHEGSHQRLGLFFRLDPLIVDDGAEVHVSPWRRDPRPLKGLLNGIHSFVNVATFYRRVTESQPDLAEYADELYCLQRDKVREGWETFAPLARPTPLGATFLAELEIAVAAL
jgi:HEXXH motif-containing protein